MEKQSKCKINISLLLLFEPCDALPAIDGDKIFGDMEIRRYRKPQYNDW